MSKCWNNCEELWYPDRKKREMAGVSGFAKACMGVTIIFFI